MAVINSDTGAIVKNLSNGFMEHYQSDLTIVQKQLFEIQDKTNVLKEQLHDENLKLSWTQNSVELQEMVDTLSIYQNRLKMIKKQMKTIMEKTNKLKRRSIRLQQFHEKEEYLRQQKLDSKKDKPRD